MAFTATELSEIRMYLGWQARWAAFDGALERGMAAIGFVEFQAEEDRAREVLVQLRRIDAAITSAEGRLKARTVGSIQLNGREIEDLRNRGRTFVGRLARILGVEVRGDAFGASMPSVDGGNYQRHG